MTAIDILEAMENIDDELIIKAVSKMNYTEDRRSPIKSYKAIVSLAAAIALLLALGITAYAFDLFGFRALLKQEKTIIHEEEYSGLSLSQPQAVPEGLDAEIAERVSKSQNAWEEWEKWLEENSHGRTVMDELPEVFRIDKYHNIVENADGSVTIEVLADDMATVVETRYATQEEYAEFNEVIERYARNPCGYDSLYDFNYRSNSAEADEALKSIADKYALALRGKTQAEYPGDSMTAAQLAELTAEIGNSGNIFRVTPPSFDKIYWYNEGSYCVSYDAILASGQTAFCYGYNSMYSTLSSGEEVINWEQDLGEFSERGYTAADGTMLTILSKDNVAYIYVYLENSFFAMKAWSEADLTDSDINRIADGLNYGLIGK